MPNYAQCQIATRLAALPKNTAGQDAAVVPILKDQTKIAIENTKLYKAEIDRLKSDGKAAIATMEARLATIKGRAVPDPTDLPSVKAGVAILQGLVANAGTEGAKLMAALAEYRGGWDITAKKLVADAKTVELYAELRKKQINDMKLIKAEENRIDEYLKRAELLVKDATDLSSTAAKATSQLRDEITNLLKRVKAHATEIEAAIFKDANKFKTFDTMFKGKQLDSKQKLDAEGLGKHLEAGRKNVKGSLKTLKAETDQLLALARPKAFIFKPAIDETNAALKSATDAVADFETKVGNVATEIQRLKR